MARNAGETARIIVRVVDSGTGELDMRLRVFSSPRLHQRGERKEQLREGEDEHHRPAQRTRKHPGVWHESHTRTSLRPFRLSCHRRHSTPI